MREANLRAARGGRDGSPEAVARWLWERIEKQVQKAKTGS
jgi:hypothetical protein